MLHTHLVAFVLSFVVIAALTWVPDSTTYLALQTAAMEFARSNLPVFLLIGLAAAVRLAWMAYRDWERRATERWKMLHR